MKVSKQIKKDTEQSIYNLVVDIFNDLDNCVFQNDFLTYNSKVSFKKTFVTWSYVWEVYIGEYIIKINKRKTKKLLDKIVRYVKFFKKQKEEQKRYKEVTDRINALKLPKEKIGMLSIADE